MIVKDKEYTQRKEQLGEMLTYHYKFGHVPFNQLRGMVKQGILPKGLAKCPNPVCLACLYAKATKRKWRGKSRSNKHKSYKPTRPGEVISVDQLKLPTPGLVAQMTGFLTKQ